MQKPDNQVEDAVVREVQVSTQEPGKPTLPPLRLVAGMDPNSGAIIGLAVRDTIAKDSVEWVSKVVYQDVGVLLQELQECSAFMIKSAIQTAFANGKRVGAAEALATQGGEETKNLGDSGPDDDQEIELKDGDGDAVH